MSASRAERRRVEKVLAKQAVTYLAAARQMAAILYNLVCFSHGHGEQESIVPCDEIERAALEFLAGLGLVVETEGGWKRRSNVEEEGGEDTIEAAADEAAANLIRQGFGRETNG
jgi:hypothetical protein